MKKKALSACIIIFFTKLTYLIISNITFINKSNYGILDLYFNSNQITVSLLDLWKNLGLFPLLISGELLEMIFLISFVYLIFSILISHKKDIEGINRAASIYLIIQFLILFIINAIITYFVFLFVFDSVSLLGTQIIVYCYLTCGYINLITYPVVLLYSTGAIIIQIRYKYFLKSVVRDKFRTLTHFKSLDQRLRNHQNDFKAWYDLAEFFSRTDKRLALACIRKCLKINDDFSKGIKLKEILDEAHKQLI